MLKGKSRIIELGPTSYILLPYTVKQDSQFPFNRGDELILEIDEDKVIIKKQKEGEDVET